MFTNLGLKLKVFFLMAVVIAALSAANFLLFRDFLVKIDVQDGAKNAAKLAEEQLKTQNYSLISNSFAAAKQLKIEKGVTDVKSDFDYAVVDRSGAVIGGTLGLMESYAGIPAVDRALKDGVASDGILSIDKKIYLIGVAPAVSEGGKLFAVISSKQLSASKIADVFPMPVKIFKGKDVIAENFNEKWSEVEKSYGKELLDSDISALVSSSGSKELNKWTRLTSFFMPYDDAAGEKVTVVTMTSLIPGWESYDKVRLYTAVYGLIAVVIAIFFTFIVTHEIDKILRKLASDISRMRVGEKLVLKKYSNGADIAVSALNKLISKYIEMSEEGSGSIAAAPIGGAEDFSAKGLADLGAEIPDPFASSTPIENGEPVRRPAEPKAEPKTVEPQVAPKPAEPKPMPKPEVKPQLPDADDDEDDENEKTQIAAATAFDTVAQKIADPMEALWEDFCRIKRKNGEPVNEAEKAHFIGKVKTNKASIMAKYKCADVQFAIEEKDGKPVVKAKPITK